MARCAMSQGRTLRRSGRAACVFVGAQHATPSRPVGEAYYAMNTMPFYAPYGAGRSMLRR